MPKKFQAAAKKSRRGGNQEVSIDDTADAEEISQDESDREMETSSSDGGDPDDDENETPSTYVRASPMRAAKTNANMRIDAYLGR